MRKQNKIIKVDENQQDELYAGLIHIGSGFERRLAENIAISYQYIKPSEVPIYKNNIISEPTEYFETSLDLLKIPKGVSKFNHWDRTRDLIQNTIIDKIKKDQGSNKTFLLYLRPRIEAITLTRFNIRLEGIWVKESNVKQVNAPEDIEDIFPFE